MLLIIFHVSLIIHGLLILSSSPASLYSSACCSCLHHQVVCESNLLEVLSCKSRQQQLPGCCLCYVFCSKLQISLLLSVFKLNLSWWRSSMRSQAWKIKLVTTTHSGYGVINVHTCTCWVAQAHIYIYTHTPHVEQYFSHIFEKSKLFPFSIVLLNYLYLFSLL